MAANASANFSTNFNDINTGLFGTDVNQNANTTQNTSTNSTSTIDQFVQQLTNSLVNQQSNTNQNQVTAAQTLGDQQLTQLNDLITQLIGKATGADAFSQVRDAVIANVLKSGMGTVIASGNNARAYDSTVTGTAGTKLAAEAANQGATAQIAAQNDLLTRIQNLFAVAKGATATTQTSGTQSQTGSQSTSTNQTQKTTGTKKDSSTSVGTGTSSTSSSSPGLLDNITKSLSNPISAALGSLF